MEQNLEEAVGMKFCELKACTEPLLGKREFTFALAPLEKACMRDWVRG